MHHIMHVIRYLAHNECNNYKISKERSDWLGKLAFKYDHFHPSTVPLKAYKKFNFHFTAYSFSANVAHCLWLSIGILFVQI